MRVYKKHFLYLLIYFLSVISLLIYFHGFFGIEYSTNVKIDRLDSEKGDIGAKRIDKLAFIVIDALRYDFVTPLHEQKYMPFTLSSILNNQSCLLMAKAHSPTVTMPRIKAITSGTVSNYIDVVLNLMSSDFKGENFISIAALNNINIVFYGDDTWIKLFPDAFVRSEGTNSFFSLDFTEVDTNVTRHIDSELKKTDWEIIILHYLGLDHIGHIEGPTSPLIKKKLEEMDSIVEKFSMYFKSLEEKGLKTLLIVTSDHGMKDSGSHGGVTFPEINVPLLSVGHPCVTLPGWPHNHATAQIDIAPTLSALFGLPYPARSMGKIIPEFFHNVKYEDVLKNLEINRKHISKFQALSENGPESDTLKAELHDWLSRSDKNTTALNHLVHKYFQFLDQVSKKLVDSSIKYNFFYLIWGATFIWICFAILLHQILIQLPKPQNLIHWFLIFGTVFHAVSFASSSFIEEEHQTWYFLWTTFCILSFLKSLKLNDLNELMFEKSWILIGVIHRILRKLNQTGDKWASLPDIKSYLISQGNTWLFPLFILSVILVFCCCLRNRFSKIQFLTFGISLFAVVFYRIATGNFHSKYLKFYPLSSGQTEVSIFWISFGAFILQTAYRKTSFYLIWLLLATLLLRPHNIILLSAQVFISGKINIMFPRSKDVIWNSIAHIWLGNLFYFYQGNGNSLANVDVASAFVGIQTYNPVYAALMVSAHTSNSHILSYILSSKSYIVFAVLRLIPLVIYCTLLFFQLHHLFIWSIFSPKLLYEGYTTLMFLILMVLNYFCFQFKL